MCCKLTYTTTTNFLRIKIYFNTGLPLAEYKLKKKQIINITEKITKHTHNLSVLFYILTPINYKKVMRCEHQSYHRSSVIVLHIYSVCKTKGADYLQLTDWLLLVALWIPLFIYCILSLAPQRDVRALHNLRKKLKYWWDALWMEHDISIKTKYNGSGRLGFQVQFPVILTFSIDVIKHTNLQLLFFYLISVECIQCQNSNSLTFSVDARHSKIFCFYSFVPYYSFNNFY